MSRPCTIAPARLVRTAAAQRQRTSSGSSNTGNVITLARSIGRLMAVLALLAIPGALVGAYFENALLGMIAGGLVFVTFAPLAVRDRSKRLRSPARD